MTSEQRADLLADDNKRLQAENDELKRKVALWQAEAELLTKKYLLATRPDGFNIYECRILCDECGKVWETERNDE